MTFDNYTLRLICLDDAEQFLELISSNRTRISEYFPKTAMSVYDRVSAIEYVKAKNIAANEKDHFCFIIEDTLEKKLSGVIFLKSFDWTIPKCELGYFIDKDKEGQGITSKAISEIIKFCFDNLKLNKLFLRTALANSGSKKVAEKNDFIVEGILRKDFKTENEELIDVVYYGLLRKIE